MIVLVILSHVHHSLDGRNLACLGPEEERERRALQARGSPSRKLSRVPRRPSAAHENVSESTS